MQKLLLQQDCNECLNQMLYKIESILNNENIPLEMKVRIKNIYMVYIKNKDIVDIVVYSSHYV